MLRLLFSSFFLLPLVLYSQKIDKIDRIAFCGEQLKNKERIKDYYQPQFNFLQVAEGDTIVDIGAGSGWYEGAFLPQLASKT